jgi:hypothetical protein
MFFVSYPYMDTSNKEPIQANKQVYKLDCKVLVDAKVSPYDDLIYIIHSFEPGEIKPILYENVP